MEKDIGKISKNDTTDIILRIDDFGGRKGLTIREFVTSDRYTGFTKSGVRILSEDFQKFKEMINSISDEDMKEEPSQQKETSQPEESPQTEKPQEEETSSAQGNKEELPDY